MSIEELRKKLRTITERESGDPEADHSDAEIALLEYIDDPEVSALYEELEKWYA